MKVVLFGINILDWVQTIVLIGISLGFAVELIVGGLPLIVDKIRNRKIKIDPNDNDQWQSRKDDCSANGAVSSGFFILFVVVFFDQHPNNWRWYFLPLGLFVLAGRWIALCKGYRKPWALLGPFLYLKKDMNITPPSVWTIDKDQTDNIS